MQADVSYAFDADESLDLLQLAAGDHSYRKIFVADEPPKNFPAPLRKPHIIRMPP
jgi:hypothetical protein